MNRELRLSCRHDGETLVLLDGVAPRQQPLPIEPRRLVAVLGNVRTQGLVQWREGMTVADAITLAGGTVLRVPKIYGTGMRVTFIDRERLGAPGERVIATLTSQLLPDDDLFVGSDLVAASK